MKTLFFLVALFSVLPGYGQTKIAGNITGKEDKKPLAGGNNKTNVNKRQLWSVSKYTSSSISNFRVYKQPVQYFR